MTKSNDYSHIFYFILFKEIFINIYTMINYDYISIITKNINK